MKFGLEVTVVWTDPPDMVQLRIRAATEGFSGEADVYAAIDAAHTVADLLRGFPEDNADVRRVELGSFESGLAGGGCRLNFRLIDKRGHAEIEAFLRADPQIYGNENVTLRIPVEPAGIDEFVKQLEQMTLGLGSTAYLRAAT
jgi:hypothetical protein